MHTNEIPETERHLYNDLYQIRTTLLELKNNRKEFMKSSDIKKVYDKVLGKYKELKQIRTNNPSSASNSANRRGSISATVIGGSTIHNKVDTVLDEVFQLLSLSFMTVGLTKTAPATYASLSTVQRLLEHLVESKVYTKHDLKPIKDRLAEIQEIVKKDDYYKFNRATTTAEEEEKSNIAEEQDLLNQKLHYCMEEYKIVEKNVDEISPELTVYLNELITLRRLLMGLFTRRNSNDPSADSNYEEALKRHEEQLKELEKHRDENGDFLTKDDKEVKDKKGQSALNGLLDECHNIINDLTIIKNDNSVKLSLIDKELLPLFNKLIKIKISLENLLVTRRWTLRETDLFSYQKELQKIDDLRVDGKFRNSNNEPYSKGQTMLLYLLRRCYAIIYKLLESSEPVSEALQPIHNQLSTVRRCLLDVKRMGGISSTRELYPYQMKLASIDDLREDGKFIVDGQIPEGQGTLNALLAECYDICYELRLELDEKAEDSDEDDNDDDDDDNNEEDRQYDALDEEDYDDEQSKNLLTGSEYEYDSYLPSENVTDNEAK